MNWNKLMTLITALAFVAAIPSLAAAKKLIKTDLTGFEEVPAVSTQGEGQFMARFDQKTGVFHYRLAYEDLEGEVLQAHIHFGQKGVNGGVSVFLCTNLGNAPSTTPSTVPGCPGPNTGMVEGMFTAGDIIGPDGQGIAPGEFEEFLQALQAGLTYVNVHSELWPGGEIRGQIDGKPMNLPLPLKLKKSLFQDNF